MAESAKSEASFRISIDGNAAESSKNVAASARLAAKAIAAYEDEVKDLTGDLRRLKGNSDEVNAAKKAIKERVDRARASITALTVELNKQGVSYAAAAQAAKKYGAGVGAQLSVAAKGAAGKAAELGKGAASAIAGAIGKAGAPVAKKVGAALAPAAKKVAATFAPAAKKVGVVLRPAGQAVARVVAPAGRATTRIGGGLAKAVGQLGAVAKPVAQQALPSLSSALSLAATGAVTAGAAIAAAAVGAAAAFIALGIHAADAAQKLNRQRQALLGNADDATRLGDQITALAGKVPQGVAELHALSVELSKTRLPGKALVDTMNAVAQASGAIDASAGAKIQDILTRGQFTGRTGIGLFELQGTGIDFDEVAKEYAAGTKKSVDAARKELLAGVAPIDSAAAAIRSVTEKKFSGLNIKNAFSLENAPKKFFEQFKSLTAGINFEPLTKALQEAFAQLSPDAPLGRAVKTFFEGVGSDLVSLAARGIPAVVEGFKWMMVGALRVGAFFYEMKKKIADAFNADNWIGAGKAIVEGLVKGFVGYEKFLGEAVTSMAGTIKDAFKGALGIHSPSKVFAQYGAHTTEGYAQGVERSSRRAQGAVDTMIKVPNEPAGGSGGPVPYGDVHLHFHGAPVNDVGAMQSPAFLAAITRAVRDARTAQGAA